MPLPKKVTLVEVGPRDGLQNEPQNVPTHLKIEFINQLSQSGLSVIEATSFVSPKWVPQMADHREVMEGITRNPSVRYTALVPNEQGFDDALDAHISEVSVFTAASETFSQKNTNCSIEESLNRIARVIERAKKNNLAVRGYVSCVLGCPYEGEIALHQVLTVAERLVNLGCYQISLGDTIGIGTPLKAQQLIDVICSKIPIEKIAVHFHDTYAQALTNIYVSLEKGVSTIDSAVAGLGGCPYAPGAGGNVATEDVVYLLNGMKIECGVDLKRLTRAGRLICDYLGRPSRSKVAIALASR
ncbi:hydroxymethylglutaryl-CoA lyase [Coxiella burnetii]|uniref:hydroxymethylglutaryl-CoA lyase n=1 Tax=Coxiella burnetii TaxID=777 RepID=UPI000CCC1DEF|nr:hydroxymethylglutaryl-CoA lyase [Coxiella burnetii]PNT89567.1 hydroxymethylglutaryl-CoA lyase [Coxiella burnetii]